MHTWDRRPCIRVIVAGHPPALRLRDDPRSVADEPAAIVREVPDEVLRFTRGRRALIAGGQGSREAHRTAIARSLQLAELEWVFGERGKHAPFHNLESRMRPGRYDLVLFLASHTSHGASRLVESCKAAQIPLVYLARGYSVVSVVEAIRQQLVARRAHA